MQFLNKMERRFGKYAISGLMRYVVALYIIGYVIEYAFSDLIPYLTLEPYFIFHGAQIWRIVSWLLIPPSRSNIIFIVFMLILYYQLGNALEQTWGAFRFNMFLLGGVFYSIIGALVLYGFYAATGHMAFFGSSFNTYYINLTIFIAFAACYPDMKVMLYFIIPIKMKWMALVYVVLAGYEFVVSSWPGRIAIFASLINFLIFFLLIRKLPTASPKEIRRKQNFKRQVNQTRQSTVGYIHKCAICGRTEKDDPNLQFRYCSKCNGNYEYCQDHLFTHKHVE